MKGTLFSIFLTVFFLICLPIAAENLVRNPSFEEDQFDVLVRWTSQAFLFSNDSVRFYTTKTESHTGSRSMVIKNLVPNDARMIQWVSVESNTCYRLSCWVKVEGIDKSSAEVTGANIGILGIKDTGTKDITDTQGTWKYMELYGKTGPEQAELAIAVRLGFYSKLVKGTVYFDDVSMEQVEEAPQGQIISFYDDTTGSRNVNPEIFKPLDINLILLVAVIVLGILVLGGSIYFLGQWLTGLSAGRKTITESNDEYKSFPIKGDFKEKRKHPRKFTVMPIFITKRISKKIIREMEFRTKNVSMEGAFFTVDDLSLFDMDEEVQVSVLIDGDRKNLGIAKIIRKQREFNLYGVVQSAGYGIRFLPEKSKQQSRIKKIIHK
ncbi:MAG: PilZ domain-containing protein [Spirochaetales bacterium]|nr:PilZ domain-containing protein [Spirochaetales bacterium]